MTTIRSVISVLAAGVSVLGAAMADAAPVVFFGENQSPNFTVSGPPVDARANFNAALTGVGVETFESFQNGTLAPLTVSFPGSNGSMLNATLNGNGFVNAGPQPTGRFNTSPGANSSKFFEAQFDFKIAFASPIAAFGFYGTDIGDFGGRISLAFTATDGSVSNFNIGSLTSGADGGLLFWGFSDHSRTYTSVSFENTAVDDDVFGFDDMVIADAGQLVPNGNGNGNGGNGNGNGGGQVPEPATFALAGLGLATLAGLRRRRKR